MNEFEEYLDSIGILDRGNISDDGAYVVDLNTSDDYGKIFSKLEKCEDLEILQDSQVVTEQGSSLIYESKSTNYILNLISDWESDKYQLVINNIED